MKPKVMDELSRLEETGVIKPVDFSDWATPVVPVLKSNGQIRICGDYKLTVNQVAKGDKYPLPHIDEICSKLSNGKYYSKLDLSHAYQQLVLDSESQKLTTNTPKGLFVYTRLPFGASAAPGIFQRTIDGILQGIPMTAVYLDDIIVTGRTEVEHMQNLHKVLTKLSENGLRLKK